MSSNPFKPESDPDRDVPTSSADTEGPERAAEDMGSFDAIAAAAELDAILASPAGLSETRTDTSEAYDVKLEAEIDELNGIIADRDRDLELLRDELGSAIARVEREAKKQGEQRARAMLLAFLDVLDDLDRAAFASRQGNADAAILEGIELVRKSFLAKLKSFGVTHMPALGEMFDPSLHDAVSIVAAEPEKNGIIVSVVREGYAIHDEVLRPATVVIGRGSA